MRKIDHDSREPKYLQLKDIILDEIRDGHLRIGDKVPSRAQLMERFSISDNTCKKALLSLMQDKVLEGFQGKGVFVRNILAPSDIKKITFLVWKGKEILNHPASSRTVNGLMNAISETDHELSFAFFDPYKESEGDIEARLRNLNADAVIAGFIPRFNNDLLTIFKKENIPVVSLGWRLADYGPYSIVDDLPQALENTCVQLFDHGIDRIGYIGSPVNGLREKRFNAFNAAFQRKGRDFDRKYAKIGNEISSETGVELCQQLLAESPLPGAVFVDDDNVCLGVLETLRKSRINVPDDLKVMRIGGWLEFLSISTIRIPFFKLGEGAGQLVDQLLKEDAVNKKIIVPCDIHFEKGFWGDA